MASKADIATSAISAIAELIVFVTKLTGKSTAEVLGEAEADCAKRAKDPSDESDRARAEAEADMPDSTSER